MTRVRRIITAAAYPLVLGGLIAVSIGISGFGLRSLLLTGIILTLGLPQAVRSALGRWDVFEPLTLTNLALAVMFVARPLADLGTGNTVHLGYDVLPTLNLTLAVAWAGIAAFQLGYLLPVNEGLARAAGRPPSFRHGKAALGAWAFLGAGTALFGLFLMNHGGVQTLFYLLAGRQQSNNQLFLDSSGYLFNGILLFAPAALIFFALATHHRKWWHLLSFVLAAVPFVVYNVSRGTRSQLLPLFVSLFVFWYLSKERRPNLLTLLVVLLLAMSVLGWLRETRQVNSQARRQLGPALTRALGSPVRQGFGILTSADSEMVDSMANELAIVPNRVPFRFGGTLTDTVARAIPRALWPGKPLSSNDVLDKTLWPDHFSRSRAGPAFSVLGILFANSGVLGVVVGMLLIGSASNALWRWHQLNRANTLVRLVYSMALPFTVILLRGNVPDTLARMLFFVVPLVLLASASAVVLAPKSVRKMTLDDA